ncbi:3989_t:CDS:2 [Ambispora leptoticha]|uniref:3989_t:CDS:1 n=1 Tax=Ambispora leptoticha TaxID=144679 RepID=A0A9N9F8Q3_9GLOM|nr:3989_t:CDS:2 [Ambispora leptoticha]
MQRLRRSRLSNIFLQNKKPSTLDQIFSIWTKGNERFEDDQQIVERIQHWLEINAQSATTLFEKIYMESLRDITYTPLLAFFYHWGIGTKVNPDETFHWYKIAAERNNNMIAQNQVGGCFNQCVLVDTFLNLLSTNQLSQLKAKQQNQPHKTPLIEEVAIMTLDILLPRKKPLFANGRRASFWRVINAILRLMKKDGARIQSIYGIPETNFANGIIGFFEKRPELASWISNVKSYRFFCGAYDYPRHSITILSNNLNTMELCFGRRRAVDHCVKFLENMSPSPNLKRFVIKGFKEFDMIDNLLIALKSVARNLIEIEFIETSFRDGQNFSHTEAIQSLRILSFIKCSTLTKKIFESFFKIQKRYLSQVYMINCKSVSQEFVDLVDNINRENNHHVMAKKIRS